MRVRAVPEADRGGGEGAGAQAEVDDGVLPAPDADHLHGIRWPRGTVGRRCHTDPVAAAAPRRRDEAARRRARGEPPEAAARARGPAGRPPWTRAWQLPAATARRWV